MKPKHLHIKFSTFSIVCRQHSAAGRVFGVLLMLLYLNACTPKAPPLMLEAEPPKCGIQFQNKIQEDSLHNMIDYSYCYNGSGVGIGDLDGDGLPEIFFAGNQTSCRLYKNLGNVQFKDITQSAGLLTEGWCTGITFADVNADGRMDIYVCRAGNFPPEKRKNLLFIQQKDLFFVEKAAEYGLADSGWSTQAAFFDFDKDGDLDCYVLNATNEDRYPNRIKEKRQLDGSSAASDKLYRNDTTPSGQPIFTDISTQAGIADDAWGLGLSVADFNNDGWEDLYVSNDFLPNDILYLNQQNGTFQNVTTESLGHTSHFSMGNDAADFNNDGWTDIFTADMMPSTNRQRKKMAGVLSPQAYEMVLKNGYAPQQMRNTLQLNQGNLNENATLTQPLFSEIGQMAGVFATDWSWAGLFADFDLDGWKDLAITNGYRHDIIDLDFIVQNSNIGKQTGNLSEADVLIRERAKKQPGYDTPNRFFKNNQNLTFSDVTTQWSIGKNTFSNGLATGDLDNDGDMDAVANNLDAPPSIYINQTINGQKKPEKPVNWLKINLKDTGNNPFAMGATVRVTTLEITQTQHLSLSRGYQSACDRTLIFGLGAQAAISQIEVVWPDGTAQSLNNVAVNQTLLIEKRNTKQPVLAEKPSPIFKNVTAQSLSKPFVHTETPYNDFAVEPLLPHKFSNESARLCAGDVNGDGLEDVFQCGPTGQSGVWFIQQKNGNFTPKNLETGVKPQEDTDCALIDADGDGDLDLLLASGGVELEPNSPNFSPRLWLNDGKGNFALAPDRLPKMTQPIGCIATADFDQDGDTDVFLGGRRKTLEYGTPGTSCLLKNEKGTFKDVTNDLAPGLQQAGMVTTAAWADVNADGRQDLVIAGELMPIMVFEQQKQGFLPQTMANTDGFWNTIVPIDIDKDGDVDLVAGNVGLNNKYGIAAQTPFMLYAKDFDGNGYFDPISTYFVDGKCWPLPGRDDLTKQITRLRKKFNSYGAYANAGLENIFDPAELKNARILTAQTAESTLFLNNGKGEFVAKPLPLAAQTAPINAFLPTDANGDGFWDLLAVGNNYGWEVGGGRMDGSIGWLLQGDGKGGFLPIPALESGFIVKGDARDLVLLRQPNPLIIAAQNNGALMFYKNIQKQQHL